MDEVSVIIPAYNEDHGILDKLYSELTSLGCEVIVVDDGSQNPYPNSIKHGSNFGYGSALMTGIKNATRPLVITIDGDGQHQTSEVVRLYHAYKLMTNTDMVVGVRKLSKETFHRFMGRKVLNWIASLVCFYWLPDLNSGARIFKRDIAVGYFSILCRTFSFTTSLTISMMCDGYRVEFFPIDILERKNGSSHVKLFKHGFITLYYILRNGLALRTRGIRKILRSIPLWNWLTKKGYQSLP